MPDRRGEGGAGPARYGTINSTRLKPKLLSYTHPLTVQRTTQNTTAATPTPSLPDAPVPWAAVAARMGHLGFPRSRLQCLTKWPSLLGRHRLQAAAAAETETEEDEDEATKGGGGAGVAASPLSSGVRRVRAVVASDLRCVWCEDL